MCAFSNRFGKEEKALSTDKNNPPAENVSRETPENSIYRKQQNKKPELDKVRQKGNISDDNPFDFNNPTLKELYQDFSSHQLGDTS